jgi:hypothetical protein
MADKAPSAEARAAAQGRFLEIAHELEPKIARSLYEDVLPEYPNHLEALRAWLGEWNLFEEWQLRHVTHSIWMWNSEGLDYDPDAGWPHLSASYSPALQSLTPLDVAWDRGTPLDEAEDRALAAWSNYRKLIKAYYKALRGGQRVREDSNPDRHMRWLVRRRVLGQSTDKISVLADEISLANKTYEDDVIPINTIDDGIKKANSLVGPLRDEQPELEIWFEDSDDIHYVK